MEERSMPTARRPYTREEFARLAGRHPEQIRQWLGTGRIAGKKLWGTWLIPASELAKAQQQPTRTPKARVYTLEEFARVTRRHPEVVRQWLKGRRIVGRKVWRMWFIPESEVAKVVGWPTRRSRPASSRRGAARR
jgi:hypothetical protein